MGRGNAGVAAIFASHAVFPAALRLDQPTAARRGGVSGGQPVASQARRDEVVIREVHDPTMGVATPVSQFPAR
jgi:hypothetical protein